MNIFHFADGIQFDHLLEQGSIGIGFGYLLFFMMQQFRHLMDHQVAIQTRIIDVIEKNTESNIDLRVAFDRLNERLS